MDHALVIGSVPVMHYRPQVGRSPTKVDADTGQLVQEAAQELIDDGESVVRAYSLAFKQIGVDPAKVRFIFWSWQALQTIAEPRRSQLQEEPFPAIFSFTENGAPTQVHPSSVFRNAAHHLTSRDRKHVDLVRWGNLPF